jgi:protein-S-isoprenylcysteine O-methyltransferase Ste14
MAMLDNELVYRAAVGGLGILGFAVRIYYQRRFGQVQRTAAGGVRDKIFYWLVFSALVLPFFYTFSTLLDFAHVSLPAPLRWVGLLIGMASLLLFVSTHHALGRNWSGVLEIAEQHRLIESGPYKRVRHPMYTAIFGVAISNALLSANWLIAVAGIVSVTLMYLARVTDEERMLIEQFGDEYRAYMQRTGRLLPPLFSSK